MTIRAALAGGIGVQRRQPARQGEQKDVARDRGRHGRAAAAVFDDDRHGIARRVHRRVADEQRVVAAYPRQLVVRDHAPRAFRRGDVADLAGAGLARHAPFRPHDARLGRRAAAAVHHGVHARPRDLALELPPTPLGAVMSNDQWEQVYDRIAMLGWNWLDPATALLISVVIAVMMTVP